MGRSNSEWDDWKRWIKGWPFKGDAPDDTQYIKDRNKLFKENGIKISYQKNMEFKHTLEVL